MEFYGFAIDYGEEMTNSFLNDENSLPDIFVSFDRMKVERIASISFY